jgi:hypothetical protein
MSMSDSYRQRRREISTRESVATLDHMNDFFGDGETWRQHVYQGNDGGRCLVAAANHVRVSPIDDAKHWLRQAIKEKTGLSSIEQFNDTRSSFAEIKEVLDRARELARTGGAQVPALVGEVLPPVRAALPAANVPAVQRPANPPVAGFSDANSWDSWGVPAVINPWEASGAPAPVAPRTRRVRIPRAPRASLWDWAE